MIPLILCGTFLCILMLELALTKYYVSICYVKSLLYSK